MGALSSLNLAVNNLGLLVLPDGLRSRDNNDAAPWIGPDGQEQNENPKEPLGVIAIANAIPDMGTLLVLSLKSNKLGTKEAGEVLGNMIKANSVLKELDLSDNYVDSGDGGDAPGFAEGISKGLPDNGALSLLSLKDNRLATPEGGKALAQALANNSTLKELDVSSNIWKDGYDNWQGDGPRFAQEIAFGIKDNGTMTSLNLAGNNLGAEGAKIVAEAIKVTKCTPAIIFGSIFMSICLLNQLLLFAIIRRMWGR
jgi:Ran GTPase-activating protein (RanGAP) involved in mRNA processing and transport